MKKVLLVPVCYNAERDAHNLLSSIEIACQLTNNCSVTVALADNSVNISKGLREYSTDSFEYYYKKFDNLGYFPGFFRASEAFEISEFDFVIVCNVDLTVDKSFFKELCRIKTADACIFAPSIISTRNGRDLNPKIISRPTRQKIRFLYNLFKLPSLYKVYHKLSLARAKRESEKPHNIDDGREIYAPHGSFVIFHKSFFELGGSIQYPRFLFCEELFLGEKSLQIGATIRYSKMLKIFDTEHGSTSKLDFEFLSKQHVLSYRYILRHYF